MAPVMRVRIAAFRITVGLIEGAYRGKRAPIAGDATDVNRVR